MVDWAHDANVLPYVPAPNAGDDADLEFDDEDDAAAMPKSVVIDDAFFWEGDRPPQIPFADTVIYETHVKGFTMRHPGVREDLRGTYAGLASDEAIAYLVDLGVTAVELLPVHHISDESFLAERGLRNHWGYSTIGYLAPHSEYAATGRRGEQVREFKGMVKALHRAGIEVILDVVYNHTAEGNHLGPMLAFKGADNASYYRLIPDDPRHYMDFTGTGNSLNPVHPSVLRLIMDSLRYWVTDCHVDGFRFDLASALAREFFEVDRLSAFFDVIHQDPVLSQVKLIAEPWDVGPGGYQVGNFPVLWSEWNGVYRDTMRDWWRGQSNTGSFASRLAGSSDLYESDGREPFASINFITAHDGFTLRDLVSYNEKHNEVNQEGNRDGTDDNRSWNCGVEGDTDSADVLALRTRQQRNFLTTLLISQGTPMLLAGDEMNRTQHGNNNAWCQDNEISWFDWTEDPAADELRDFTRRLIALRRRHPVFRRESFLRGAEVKGSGLPDVWWFRPDGRKMTRRDWQVGEHALGTFLNGAGDHDPRPPRRGHRGRLLPAPGQRPSRGPAVHAAAAPLRRPLDARALHRRSGGPVRVSHLRSADRGAGDLALDRDPQANRRVSELRATYRLQLTSEFGFGAARSLVPYLRDLGISHLYLSPSFQARPGSTHGYDVVDPQRLSDALGGEAEFRRLSDDVRDAGLGIVLDVVPNHMGADDANQYWADPELREKFFDVDPATGRHRRFFDIDDLAAIRQEDPDVFEATHALALALVNDGLIDGLRVDHPDGLADPAGYLTRLAERGASNLWVEKILNQAHRPSGCATGAYPAPSATSSSTTLRRCSSIPAREAPMTELWERISGDRRPFGEVAFEAKLEQAHNPFGPELERLARELGGAEPPGGLEGLRRAVASLPVYRTYVEPWSGRSPTRTGAPSTPPTCPPSWPRCCCSSARRRPPSSPAFSRPPRRSWPRASRTPRSTATPGCWRSTTSAAIRRGSGSTSTASTPATSSASSGSPTTC